MVCLSLHKYIFGGKLKKKKKRYNYYSSIYALFKMWESKHMEQVSKIRLEDELENYKNVT